MANETMERWKGHAGLARLIRVSVFVVPFAASVATAFVLSTRLPAASSLPEQGLRLFVILVAATAMMMIVDRLARRLLPLSALFHLTLIFPDQAPSRFKIALKTSSSADLEERIAAALRAPEGETRGEAAERLLELVGLLSHHDHLTRGHSERVRAYTQILGEEMGLNEVELDKIRWAGLLHDVGKTTIPSEILNKPGKLTDEEFEIIKGHPEAGRQLVAPLQEWLGDSLRAVWEHHERWDGTGYPRRLSGTDISLGARIVSVADTYDVITSARSYKQPLSAVEARAELARCAGEQFDPVVVRAFLNISLGRLRWMAGPSAWLAQLALFEPAGVVHAGDGGSTVAGTAGSSSAGSSAGGVASASASGASAGAGSTAAVGSSAAAGATTASTAASVATSAAAAGGTSGAVGTITAIGVGVAAGTTGVVAADVPIVVEEPVETAMVEDAGPVAAVDEPIALAQGFAPRVTLVRQVADDPSGESGADAFASSEPVDVPASGSSDRGASPADGVDESSASPRAAGSGEPGDGTIDGGFDSDDIDVSGDEADDPSTPGVPTSIPAGAGSSGSNNSGGGPTSTIPANPPVTVPTTTPVTPGVPPTVDPGVPPTVTVPPNSNRPDDPAGGSNPPGPPPTVPVTVPSTVPTPGGPPAGSLGAGATKLYLEAGPSTAPWAGTFADDKPADVPLADLDVAGDGDAGLTLPRTGTGVSSVVPGTVAVFRSQAEVAFLVEKVEKLEVHVAADDFEKDDVHVAASLLRCTGWLCTTIASDSDEEKNADDFGKVKLFDDLDLDVLMQQGDVLELRIAILDDSESDGMLAFGTKDFDSYLQLKIDDNV